MTKTTAAQPATKSFSLFIASAAIAAILAAAQPVAAQRAGGLFGEESTPAPVLAPGMQLHAVNPSLSLSAPVAYRPLREGIEPLDEFARHALLQLYDCAPPGFDIDARPLGRFAPPQLYRSGPAGKTLETASLTE